MAVNQNIEQSRVLIMLCALSLILIIVVFFLVQGNNILHDKIDASLVDLGQNKYTFKSDGSISFSFELPEEFEIDSVKSYTGLELYLDSLDGQWSDHVKNTAPNYHQIIIRRTNSIDNCCFDFSDDEVKFNVVHGDWKDFIIFYAGNPLSGGLEEAALIENTTSHANQAGTEYLQVSVDHVFTSYAAGEFAIIDLNDSDDLQEYLVVLTDVKGKYGPKSPNQFPEIFDSIVINN
ncbi:hypothetical protein GF357_04355 [Candidatus Dojkabacteria bacterium]|nr:hypothetical protein [Candidatus Dojkabacteria bacterium]